MVRMKRKWKEIESGGPSAGRTSQDEGVEWGRSSRETGSSLAQRKWQAKTGRDLEMEDGDWWRGRKWEGLREGVASNGGRGIGAVSGGGK